MGIFSRFFNKRTKQPAPIKNTVPEEKKAIRKAFGIYCHSHHNTSGKALCPKCNALLMTAMTKIQRCPYGITKPLCHICETPCFGQKQTMEFRKIMKSSQRGMFFRHPMMFIKQKLKEWGFAYMKQKQNQKK
ncbi:nitrous oxide-stimulated promoter family protein [Pectinatus sottacetonis]|uniref:nitrous oxide-stimulated promoter family protein n=1 Tax=Pectinatus sottacetonis TaxID=1002795 RepID=UPI0018C80940|nr:nitrous oxide-stimulated promoter family protein [Pectinatus sottacetonis]